MAGEIEDRIGYQVDCLPTESISFGQFDEESLCWERKSSFSRNKYLEEVEKYSKPGSVVEKKAYFEAHFKRKALLLQAALSECQNGLGLQTSENDSVDGMNDMEEFEHNDNEVNHYARCKNGFEYQTSENNIVDHMNYMEDFEINSDEENHCAQYDETPDHSDEEHEHMVTDCEVEDISPKANATVSKDTKNVEPGEMLTDKPGCNTLPLISNDSEVKLERELESKASTLKTKEDQKHTSEAEISITEAGQERTGNAEISISEAGQKCTSEAEISKTEAEQNYTREAETSITGTEQKHTSETDCSKLGVDHSEVKQMENVNRSLKKPDKMTKNSGNRMDHAIVVKNRHKPSLNVKSTVELQATRPKAQTHVSGAQILQKKSHDVACLSSAKTSSKTQVKLDKESPLITKRERQLPMKAPTMFALRNSTKPEESVNAKAKLNQENKRDKSVKVKQVSMVPQPATKKSDLEGWRSANRPKEIIIFSKTDSKPRTALFNFKSGERAEKRKEFYLKLEEKQHAKEAEISQLQARTQEETEAEIKQLRKSLKFKATPMPSFYHEASLLSSSGKKAAMNHEKSPKVHSKPSSSGSRISAQDRSQTLAKNGKQGLHSTGKSAVTTRSQTQEARGCNAASEANVNCQSPANRTDELDGMGVENHVLEALKKTRIGRKERDKGKASSGTQCQDGDTPSKVRNGERAKPTRVRVKRKVMKDAVDRSPEVGRLAVHVAS